MQQMTNFGSVLEDLQILIHQILKSFFYQVSDCDY